ncbi:ATP-dependent DNA helicase [Trichonephila clavipes]|nr:ATP-dependent DNA helicase [Trichonephila clavipes]
MPPHIQHLKFYVPTIISQNINQPELCNGMRLAVQKLMSNIIEATILTGPFNDEDALTPRIPMIPTDTEQFKAMETKSKEISISEREIIVKMKKYGKSRRDIARSVGRKYSSIQRVIDHFKST